MKYPVISKEDGNGALSRAHPDSKSIVSVHIGRNADFMGGRSVWITTLSRTLRQTGQECVSRAELRGKDAEPGAYADLVDLIEQIDDVEAEFHALRYEFASQIEHNVLRFSDPTKMAVLASLSSISTMAEE